MNKHDLIIDEAKRLFGRYGYLGFTLKQLAQACEMTSPALYYFYSSKADLFKDCLLSEFDARKQVVERCAARSQSLPEFAAHFAREAIEVCGVHDFRVGRAMEEIVHLPEAMQQELQVAWDYYVITPVEQFLARVAPDLATAYTPHLLATFIINLATFTAAKVDQFPQDELTSLAVAVARGLQTATTTSSN